MSASSGSNPAVVFRSLCRSSPWRWETVRFTVSWISPEGESDPLRAWVRRPAALRVETADGALLHSSPETSRDGLLPKSARKSWLVPPRLVTPVYNDAGFVHRRPQAAYGEPAFGDPRWSAMLDPVELAGDAPVPYETPFANRVELEDIAEELFEGRRVLAATATPNISYQPFTPGRPLIGSGRTRVAVDVATAICVSTTALDGPLEGCGHRLAIGGVDEYMIDDLFTDAPPTLTDVREHIPWQVS
ncbi:hypothetical protein GC088_04230 [Arthrobacter sp. JZ12]|uniref:hypothetical protein n=1 Tax=Arthrobacter sp. JZ12 TaxID=2654190 RepID=UPI002B4A452C|nr:hypothetical protein [Arthrobacter sp. JZ12]WRH24373.1 hypothetical protein GC088_04230 [Arthrobacter sp. JZ12]